MKESLKKRLDRVEEVTLPNKRSIYDYSDEELEEIVAEWLGEEGVPNTDKLLSIIQAARDCNQKG